MLDYVTRHLWDEAAPEQSPEEWILNKVLRLPQSEGFSIAQTIFAANNIFQWVNHQYYDAWNSHRADIIAAYVEPPEGELPEIDFNIRRPQKEDPGEWILTQVLGFTMGEIIPLRSLNTKFPAHKADLPLLKNGCFALGRLCLKDKLLSSYHYSRYLLCRYYIEYIYHERLIRDYEFGVTGRKFPHR